MTSGGVTVEEVSEVRGGEVIESLVGDEEEFVVVAEFCMHCSF